MAFSCYNSSTYSGSALVLLFGTHFNIILCFSDNLSEAYLPNTPRYSRHIHQRGQLSLRSPSHTIQPSQTVLPVSGPSIVSTDNNPNWEDASTTNLVTNLISNKSTSFTCSQLKLCWSINTNEQLANILGQLMNILNTNQTSSLNTNSRETKACITNTFNSTKPNKLNNFLFQYHLYFHTNPMQFDMDIIKINFAITYLIKVAQDQFEMGLNQKDQDIL